MKQTSFYRSLKRQLLFTLPQHERKVLCKKNGFREPCIEHFMEYFIKIPPCYTAQNNGRISDLTENAADINTKRELEYDP